MIKGFAHVCLAATDLDAVEHFYCAGLGLQKAFHFIRDGRVVGFYLQLRPGSYVEVFERDGIDPEAKELWLHNYVGPRTEHAKIAVGEGVIGRAAGESTNQNVPDVSQIDYYIEDHPGMSSELAILIRAGDDVFGIIDIDSMEPSAFTPDDESAIGQVADKLAEQLVAERR